MFTVKVMLLVFALFIFLDTTIPCIYRIPIGFAAIIIEQILNAKSEKEYEERKHNRHPKA